MTTLINCTQHKLNSEQISQFESVVELKDIAPELFDRLSNSPSQPERIKELAYDFISWMNDKVSNTDNTILFHLPIGSPAFMYELGRAEIQFRYEEDTNPIPTCFSHSERVMTDNQDGSKLVKFLFSHFIYMGF
jgi:hypothetical protein